MNRLFCSEKNWNWRWSRSLAAAYERQEMTEEAILAYGRLLEIEEGTGRIEEAAEKKMKLEAGQGQMPGQYLQVKKLCKRQKIQRAFLI